MDCLDVGEPRLRAAVMDLARPSRRVREERFGADVEALAAWLGIPPRTLRNDEAGVTIPAGIAPGFIALTGVDPHWLRTGEGARYAEP